jgi:NADPH-dependent 2,4-dienoyl-CoA reductase/sulfur reductase-like enzyme
MIETAPRCVIVGAGPAGMRAAEQLVAAGHRPTVIDEATRCGGQIYRQPPVEFQRSRSDLYGFEAGKAAAVLDRFAALLPRIDYRPDTLVWHVEARSLHLLQGGRSGSLTYDALILATGATDRVLPFPGWTLPGVFSLGAAQVALKFQASLIGPRVVFAGTGPLLYLVAWQYARHGGQVQAVLETSPASARLRALPGLLARPGLLAKGAYFLAGLRLRGVPVHSGVTLLGAEGGDRVEALRWRDAGGSTQRTPVDAVGFGHGLRAETQLADLAGCAFDYQSLDQAWLPRRDAAGRSSVAGVYLAGDGAGILGADAAELGGARAAMAALRDIAPAQGDAAAANAAATAAATAAAARLEARTARHHRFRAGLEILSAPPPGWAAEAPDDLVVCRCEEITAGALRACVAATGTREMNRLKALTRIGMGRCQGRMCGDAAARLLAQAAGVPLADVGRLRAQAPVKPLSIGALVDAAAPAAAVPADERDD